MKIMFIGLCALFCLIVAGCSESETSTAITASGPEDAFPDNEISESCQVALDRLQDIARGPNASKSWKERLAGGREVFEALIKEGDWQCFDALIGEFGKHGDEVDFLIFISTPGHTIPTSREFRRFELAERYGVTSESYHASRLRAAEIIAKRFYEANEAWRLRFYHGLLWTLDFQIHWPLALAAYVEATLAGFDQASGEDVWWYVRSALLLMYSTREFPELDELTPEAVHVAFVEWADRLPADERELTPSDDWLFWERKSGLSLLSDEVKPLIGARELPFPEWSEPVPTREEVDRHKGRSPF